MKFCFSLFQFQIQKERWHLSKQGQGHLWSLRSYLYCQRSCVLPVQMAHKLGWCLTFNHDLTIYKMPHWSGPRVISLIPHKHTLTNILWVSPVALSLPSPLGKHSYSKYICLCPFWCCLCLGVCLQLLFQQFWGDLRPEPELSAREKCIWQAADSGGIMRATNIWCRDFLGNGREGRAWGRGRRARRRGNMSSASYCYTLGGWELWRSREAKPDDPYTLWDRVAHFSQGSPLLLPSPVWWQLCPGPFSLF